MHTRYFVLLMGIVMVACSTAGEVTQTQLPEPTSPPEPTATPIEVMATEIPPSPSPAPTDTPPATPTQIPTETPEPIQFNFTWYESNPILSRGAAGEWDNWRMMDTKVVLVNDLFHMFYTGAAEESFGIGYAVSADGIEFKKHDGNPTFQSDEEGFDANGVSFATPLVVEDTWLLFYAGSAEGESYRTTSGGGSSIGLTTSPGPTGPWTPGQQVLKVGGSGEWDAGFILPTSVIVTEDGYRMYYIAGPDKSWGVDTCGMANSPDGTIWTKYDDPSTTEAPFAESDPVMQPGPVGWESAAIYCTVLKTDTGWEMFYEGWGADIPARIGYASSPDGIQWSKYQDNPILLEEHRSYPSVIKIGSTYYLYSTEYDSSDVFAATGTIDEP